MKLFGTNNWKLWRVLVCAIIFSFQFSIFNSAKAQIAGLNTLTLLDLSPSARTSGLGFDYLALHSDDPTLALDNPSLLNPSMSGIASLSFSTLFDGGNMGALSYVHNFKRIGPLAFAFRFNNYGRFRAFDEEETPQGEFSAADYALAVSWAMPIDSHFAIGATLKPVLSHYESYRALALAIDLAGSYFSADHRFAATLMARNIGAQITTFDQAVERLPFEFSASLSYKLSKAPFRLFFAATELQRWDLRYEDPLRPSSTTDPFTGETTSEGWFEGALDNLMRHTLFGIELNIGRSLFARVGYSYRQAQEMRGADAFNLSGFSFGIGIHTRRFDFSYARRNYHLSQAPNFFTLSYRF